MSESPRFETHKIVHRDSGRVLFEVVAANRRDAVVQAVRAGVSLAGANLIGASLVWSDLKHADFRNADLTDANLRDAYLNCANVRGATLTRTDLRDALLHGANFDDVDLSTTLIDPAARLLIAAPDLLDALRGLLNALPSATQHPAIQQARAAISKATGGEP